MNAIMLDSTTNPKPLGATHQEEDGTWWVNQYGQWYYWYHFGWAPYVGPVDKNFELRFKWVSDDK